MRKHGTAERVVALQYWLMNQHRSGTENGTGPELAAGAAQRVSRITRQCMAQVCSLCGRTVVGVYPCMGLCMHILGVHTVYHSVHMYIHP